MDGETWPSVAVLGAGAVGCYYGGMLARAGAPVTLIGRPAHVEAIVRDGLLIERAEGPETVRIAASVDGAVAGDADVVLVCVKSPDTEAAAKSLAPHLRADAVVVSLQNGVDNAERMRALLPQLVLAAVVYVGAYMPAPGVVRHTGRGDLVIGALREDRGREEAGRQTRTVAAMFERAKIACPVSADIEAALWTKLAINCAFNAVSALGQARYGTMAREPAIRALMADAVREAAAVARAEGAALDADALIAATWQVAEAMAGQYSSTAQDLLRGKRTEIDALNGHVARRGAALGIPVPINRMLHALVKLREAGDLRPDA